MELTKLSRRSLLAGAFLFTTLILAACGGIDPNNPLGPMQDPGGETEGGAALRIGDELDVTFINVPSYTAPIIDTIKEDGTITLILGEKFQAAGKTVNQLREDVMKRYVPADFKPPLDFTITTPKRSFSVGGEVKSGGSFQYPSEGIDAVTAINLAGGFTPYANHTIEITRRTGGKPIKMNFDKAQQDSRKNLKIFPGDNIYVQQRTF